MSDELKPCPFCGAEAELHDHGQGRGGWMIACKRKSSSDYCGVLMTTLYVVPNTDEDYQAAKQRVIERWNSRAAVKERGEDTKRLESAIAKVQHWLGADETWQEDLDGLDRIDQCFATLRKLQEKFAALAQSGDKS